jgi:hypothetical protein
MALHLEVAAFTTSNGDDLEALCVRSESVAGTDCFQQNLLSAWAFDAAALSADAAPLDTLNAFFSKNELESMLGKPEYADSGNIDAVTSARAVKLIYCKVIHCTAPCCCCCLCCSSVAVIPT